ncbi:MAG: 4Fe-4S dicluster domain-containing protein [Rhodothermales bacterium]
MNYGFLIRNDRCIGCHACSTACKSENDVPVGVSRTWVKSVEKGQFPNVRRHFQVTRCNHCANPPCARICPVGAMYQREDGIVEFDANQCIGCKACLQACPYDAIHIDPSSGTAAKCHYCGHRVDVGLEPACVVVCPEHAIIAGDMDEPSSEISRMLAEYQVTVRKPEQGTSPKLFYVNGDEVNLTPTAVDRTPATFAWADVLPLHEGDGAAHAAPRVAPSRPASAGHPGETLRSPQPQGLPDAGPILIGDGRMAEQMVQVAYNAQHKIPWHWPVPAYLVTKGIASGIMLLLTVGLGLGWLTFDAPAFVWSGLAALVFTMITTGFLVLDLERPERFLRILFRPQWRSWLTRGAFLLIGFSTLTGAWWMAETAVWLGWLPADAVAVMRGIVLWPVAALAVGAAVYTAFLFGQAEGRDLWQSALLPIHLIVQAVFAGAGALLALDLVAGLPGDLIALSRMAFAVALIADLLVIGLGEMAMSHASEAAARAAHAIHSGRYKTHFRWGSLALGHGLPLALLATGAAVPAAIAGLAALVGLYLYEYAFVMAPQEVPNS